MNKRILGLAIPNIITNISVPLLGMVDMAIVGHLSSAHIGAITIGTGIFNLIYWCFGFLRMGTSGFTAQAYGAKNLSQAVATLVRALAIALSVALILILLQWPISRASLLIFNGSEQVMQLALVYFFVRIWAAPATLGMYALKGWFIGMQNSTIPMWIAITANIINIICSLLFVIVLHWGIAGVAIGTVVAQYCGLLISLFFAWKRYGNIIHEHLNIKASLQWKEMRLFFKVNSDIFLRTICLATVFTFITSESGRISDNILAIDALLLQFFTLFSYIMDGFAYAGESLVGRYIGAKELPMLKQTIRLLILWGLAMTLAFTLLYAKCDTWILSFFSNDATLIQNAHQYLGWIIAIPICGFAAFLFDGIYVGATASKAMRNAMFIATLCFFTIFYLSKLNMGEGGELQSNNRLWFAFLIYLSMRGIIQALLLKKSVYSKVQE